MTSPSTTTPPRAPDAAPDATLRYQSGFGNEYATEAVAGALPRGRNSPQRAPFDLYPELISGTAFTAPRHENRRSWLYRRQPSVVAGRYQPHAQPHWTTGGGPALVLPPEPLRWAPLPFDGVDADFVDGMRTVAANGDAQMQTGVAAHVYLANRSMTRRAFVDATAVVIGDVTLGADSSIWPLTVIRGDMHFVRIGARTSIQDGSVLHITHAGPFNPES